jgi:hypothetical protein
MEIRAEIINPYYDHGGRKYMDLKWDGLTYTVKVPFRYNRVMCRVEGVTPIQNLNSGQEILAFVEKKYWNGSIYYILQGVREFQS